MAKRIEKSDAEWREQLTPEQYAIARQKGTEPAFSGEYTDHKEDGLYKCVCCGEPLFTSDEKFDSGCGWPSFSQPIDAETVETQLDTSYGMQREEVLCQACGAHLGHVFPDGPPPTGQRYCINSKILQFERPNDTDG